MSIMAVDRYRPEEVGDILIKVHEDLMQLKEQLLARSSSSNPIDISSIENAIEKTEHGIKQRTEQVLNTINNQVKMLPSLEEQALGNYGTLETTWDIQQINGLKNVEVRQDVVPGLKDRKRLPHQAQTRDTFNFTPAERLKLKIAQKAIYNPQNESNRAVMNENYGIQLPVITDKKPKQALSNQRLTLGSTIEPLAALPAANRKDPQLAPPPITDEDARHGILSLLERGLIPPGADLTLDPSPVKHKLLPIHSADVKQRTAGNVADGALYNLAHIKLDMSVHGGSTSHGQDGSSQNIGRLHSAGKLPKQKSIHMPKTGTALLQKTLELQIQPVPPPTTPNLLADNTRVQHRFPIQNGKTRETASEYMAFRQHYCLSWGPIISMLERMQTFLKKYSIPVAFIDGDKLADLALECEITQPTSEQLLTAVVNRDTIEELIRIPGRLFKGQDGQNLAATLIQSQYRMFKQRKEYLLYRHRKWAAGVIALTWVMNVKMATMKRQLKVTRIRERENFKTRAKLLAQNWNRIKSSRRVIIHLPSLGYNQQVRDTLHDFGTIQNAQMARLCDIKDPNVDVIYVSPVTINDECLQYYTKLLSLKAAIDSGNVDDQTDLSERFKIVVPEAIKSFPTHRMCLATHLKYSPKALKRIRALIHGRDAYIVTGVPHIDDLSVAEFLNVPILCPDPEVAHLYSLKSGSARIFQSAGVQVPFGDYDVYTFPQLHDTLTQLITENLDVRTWLFKIDHEFDGRGTAYIHIADHLRCYMWARKECERYGDKWSKKWAQEPVFNKIHSELPDILENHATPVNKNVYANWQQFLQTFLAKGGVVQAAPPSDSVTAITVDMLIEPDGVISTVSSGDQMHAESMYRCWGVSSPQCSVDPDQLNKECRKIAEACKARGIVGYFAIDFVTFINAKTGEQQLWATDLNLHYNDTTAMNCLVHFMTNGVFDTKEHMLNIPPPTQARRRRRRRHVSEEEELPPTTNRYAVYSTKLLHSNLTVVHYSVFFQMCRAHGIGYDVKEKQGTIFLLIDSFNRENIGMLTVGDNLQGALATFARNLSCIHQEISAPNMQGVTNFKNGIEDIESILGTTIQNANDQEQEDADQTQT